MTAGVGCGVGGAMRMAPVAINDARPTTRTTAPSDSSVLYRLMPSLIIDTRPRRAAIGQFDRGRRRNRCAGRAALRTLKARVRATVWLLRRVFGNVPCPVSTEAGWGWHDGAVFDYLIRTRDDLDGWPLLIDKDDQPSVFQPDGWTCTLVDGWGEFRFRTGQTEVAFATGA